jgi:hypothetical protein
MQQKGGKTIMKHRHVISCIVGSKVLILLCIMCTVAAHYILSQKWLEAIASEEAVKEDLKQTCEGEEKQAHCKSQINKLNSNGQTGLMVQARLGRYNDVKELFVYGADARAISNDPERTTALHLACQSVDFEDGVRIVFLLLKKGAQATVKDAHGNTPMHDLLSAASKEKKQQVATRMIERYKANLNDQNNDGDTPLHIGITKNDLDWVTYIVKKYPTKIDFTLKNNLGYTPLKLAEFYGYDQLVDIVKKAMAKKR